MKKIAIFAAALFFTSSVRADLKLDGDSTVTATVKGPAGLNIVAKTSNVVVEDDGPDISFTVPIDSLKTGISLRDEHMRKALETERFSDVKLVLHDSDLRRPGVDDSTSSNVVGALTLHGVTRPVTVHYEAVGDCENHIGVKVNFSLDMRAFGVEPPSYFGVSVKPNVNVTAQVRLADQ